MRYLAFVALLAAAPCAIAKSKAKVNTSVNPVKHLARTPSAPLAARRTSSGSSSGSSSSSSSSSKGEFCGTDDYGDDYYCEDSDTFCCTGPEIWQCAPKTAEECCTTGYYCETGEHCYLDDDDEQLCLTPEEAEDMGGDATDTDDLDLDFGDSDSDSTSSDDPEETSTSDDTTDDDEDDTTVAAGASGGKRKGGSKSAAGKVGAGAAMAGVVAVGALALA